MQRGTLNFSTRDNVFFVGSSLKRMYEMHSWILMPEESIVGQYLQRDLEPHERESFPLLEGPFKYRLLPIRGMENVVITHQHTTHVYPFKTLPSLTSHIHPRFVIMALARTLVSPDIVERSQARAWLEEYPYFREIGTLYTDWANQCPDIYLSDPSYVPEQVDGADALDDSDVDDEYESDADGTVTPPRRQPLARKGTHVYPSSLSDLHKSKPTCRKLRFRACDTGEISGGWTMVY
ncbi:hypothetical protein D9611_011708 [Ephemerocybe angulata]|uniref:Uncharacterized protein n=1 Tax=Ephemerocybe angulata TaxID=980116 RepID=A0A8H5C5K3_9AGAR|nr:hypothetical protein D9611_011708 [Tulosesus angulatus]